MLKDRTKFNSQEYSTEEKERFISKLVKAGCTSSTAYVRLFRDGFVEWQMEGIEKTARAYMLSVGMPQIAVDAEFYSHLPSCQDFFEYMEARGMSQCTVRTRFKEWNFKPWELKGVKQILPELCQDPQE